MRFNEKYNSLDADFLLVLSDNMGFRVHSYQLSAAR